MGERSAVVLADPTTLRAAGIPAQRRAGISVAAPFSRSATLRAHAHQYMTLVNEYLVWDRLGNQDECDRLAKAIIVVAQAMDRGYSFAPRAHWRNLRCLSYSDGTHFVHCESCDGRHGMLVNSAASAVAWAIRHVGLPDVDWQRRKMAFAMGFRGFQGKEVRM